MTRFLPAFSKEKTCLTSLLPFAAAESAGLEVAEEGEEGAGAAAKEVGFPRLWLAAAEEGGTRESVPFENLHPPPTLRADKDPLSSTLASIIPL